MSKKEELSEQYRRKAYEVSPTRKRCQHNNEVIAWNNEIVGAFESGWDASKEVVIDKACEWLDGVIYDYMSIHNGNVDTYVDIDGNKFIEDFRKAMGD